MRYRICSLEATIALFDEDIFNQYYRAHVEPHLGEIGEEKDHSFKPGKWKDAVLLILKWTDTGLPDKAGWFHRNDLEPVIEEIPLTLDMILPPTPEQIQHAEERSQFFRKILGK